MALSPAGPLVGEGVGVEVGGRSKQGAILLAMRGWLAAYMTSEGIADRENNNKIYTATYQSDAN
jgi:hypothetical protein